MSAEIVGTVSTTRTILIISLVLLILFIIVSIGFVFYPIYSSYTLVTQVTTESKKALETLTDTAAQAEMIFQQLDNGATQLSKAEDTINKLMLQACQNTFLQIANTPFCRIFSG